MKITKNTVGIGLVLLSFLALLAPATPSSTPEVDRAEMVRDLANEAFEVGIRTGYAVNVMGGSKDDVLYLIETQKRRDLVAFNKWFEDHAKQ